MLSLEELLEWLKKLDEMSPKLPDPRKTDQRPFPWAESNGWNRMLLDGGIVANKNESEWTLEDRMRSKHPGLVNAWDEEVRTNREPLPDPDRGRLEYQILKERRRYKGLL